MGVLCVTSCHRSPSGDYSNISFISPVKVAKAILRIVFLLQLQGGQGDICIFQMSGCTSLSLPLLKASVDDSVLMNMNLYFSRSRHWRFSWSSSLSSEEQTQHLFYSLFIFPHITVIIDYLYNGIVFLFVMLYSINAIVTVM